MYRQLLLCFLLSFISTYACGQTNSAERPASTIFERIQRELSAFKPDTSAVPEDRVTWKIRELRKLRGGFNINEVISFKLEEDSAKGELSPEQFRKVSQFFKGGQGKVWLDNASIHIYRQHFTYNELEELVRFYQTTAGQKMASEFPVIMLKSIAAAQLIKDGLMQQPDK